jgi:hypothetical protein
MPPAYQVCAGFQSAGTPFGRYADGSRRRSRGRASIQVRISASIASGKEPPRRPSQCRVSGACDAGRSAGFERAKSTDIPAGVSCSAGSGRGRARSWARPHAPRSEIAITEKWNIEAGL